MTQIYNQSHLINIRRKLRRNHTDAELVFWSKVRRKQFHNLRFRRQFSVGAYILGFYCHEKRLAIEIDGSQHLEQENYDTEREKFLNTLNICVLRFWNNDVLANVDGVLVQVEKELNL